MIKTLIWCVPGVFIVMLRRGILRWWGEGRLSWTVVQLPPWRLLEISSMSLCHWSVLGVEHFRESSSGGHDALTARWCHRPQLYSHGCHCYIHVTMLRMVTVRCVLWSGSLWSLWLQCKQCCVETGLAGNMAGTMPSNFCCSTHYTALLTQPSSVTIFRGQHQVTTINAIYYWI